MDGADGSEKESERTGSALKLMASRGLLRWLQKEI